MQTNRQARGRFAHRHLRYIRCNEKIRQLRNKCPLHRFCMNGAGRYNLGRMYQAGVGGLPRSRSEAARWFRLAAAQGSAAAQKALQRFGQR